MDKNIPKPVLYAIGTVVMLIFVIFTWLLPYQAMARCLEAGGAYAQSLARCDSDLKSMDPAKLVGLVFIRLIDGQRVSYIQEADLPIVGILNGHRFSMEVLDQGTHYRMVMRGQTTKGALHIERRNGADDNGLIYVLTEQQHPEKQLRFLLRQQGQGNTLEPMDADGQVRGVTTP